jgi:TRAP-type C4-dicarboxylate transport system substrate-binding protein
MQSRLFVLFFLILCGTWSCQSRQEPEVLLRASLLVAEEHTWYRAFQHFEALLETRSNGRIKLQTYPSEQLAKEIEAIRMIQAGVIDMTTTSALLSNWADIMTFCEMPFLMDSMEEVDTMLNGPVGARIRREMVEKPACGPWATSRPEPATSPPTAPSGTRMICGAWSFAFPVFRPS